MLMVISFFVGMLVGATFTIFFMSLLLISQKRTPTILTEFFLNEGVFDINGHIAYLRDNVHRDKS
jgi:hypothetical protein